MQGIYKTASTRKVGKTATRISTVNEMTRVTYHSTDVVTFDNEQIILNSGGYRTNTTKTRMNQAANQFGLNYQIFQKDYNWYVVLDTGNSSHQQTLFNDNVIEFYDGMCIERN